MKRATALALGVMIAGFAALGVIPGTAVSAAASDPFDIGDYFEANWSGVMIPDPETGQSPFDDVYNFIFGVPGVKPSGGLEGGWEICTPDESDPTCEATVQGYRPSPAGVAPVFTKLAPTATGVTMNSGSATGATVAGLVADMTGLTPGTMTVDTAATDLTVEAGGVDGWVGGANAFGPFTLDIAGLDYGDTGTLNLTMNQSTCVGFWLYGAATSQGCYTADGGLQRHSIDYSVYRIGGSSTSANTGGGAVPSNTYACPDGWCWPASITDPVSIASPGLDYVLAAYKLDGITQFTTYWYPVGHVLYEVAAGGFVGTMESTIVCRTAAGDTNTYSRAVEVSSPDAYVDVALERFDCGAGELLLSALVDWVTAEGTQNVYDYSAPDWVIDTPAEWQNCGDQNCQLKLYNGTQYCGENAIGCPEWWEQEAEGYACKLGPYEVELNYCSIFRVPGQKSPSGKISVDVDTGELVYETPESKPRSWFDSLAWSPPGTPVTPPDVEIIQPGVGDPSSDRSKCFPTGWGILNPLEWVYRPTTCALSWAFVPKAGVAQFAAITTALAASPLGEVQVFFGGIVEGLQIEGRECVTLVEGSPDAFMGSTFEVNTCDEWLAAAGPVARTGLGWLAILLGAFGAFAVVSAAFDVKSGIRSEGE